MRRFLILSLISLFVSACVNKDQRSEKIFKEMNPSKTGITFTNTLTETDSLNYFNYAYIYMGGGVASGDINNDGLIDLFFTGNQVSNKVYLNKGNLKFEDITDQAGLAGDKRWYTGVTMADVNNDGLLDIYCSVGGKYAPKENQLFINNGDLTFTDKAEQYGVADIGNSVQATFFDYDLDGDLDLYVANYPPTRFNAPNNYYRFKMSNHEPEESDKLYKNNGDSFTDVTKEAGLDSFGLSLSATVGDLNSDGWPDLYVSNDFSTPDFLFINNQDGTFTDHVKETTKQNAFYGMGVDIADYNNDLLLDIFQVDMSPQSNRRSKANMASMNPALFWSTINAGFHYQYMQNNLQLNNGLINDSLPDFSNVSRLAGVSSTDWSWGPLFADLDNDGWKDLFVSNGTRREINNRDYFLAIEAERDPFEKVSMLEKSLAIPSEKIDNYVLKNLGDLTFEKINKTWGIEFEGFSNGAVYADLDNDGDLEIVTNNIDDKASLFENTSSTKNNYIALEFKGNENNKFGLGVKAELETTEGKQFQELTLTRGFQSSVAPRLHFGIGKATQISTLKITWPDGRVQHLSNISGNQLLTINYENAVENVEVGSSDGSTPIFKTMTDFTEGVRYLHRENFYDDFEKEILLPHKMSSFGPNVSVGDLNMDGKDDLLIGGSAGNSPYIFFQTASGFAIQHIISITEDKEYEDMGSLIFDADNDGDQDIYMVSGGNEFLPASDTLQDRLYVNDGTGNFTRSKTAIPQLLTSGSKVYGNDFDKDGDLDLFVGGRLIPGNYPSPAASYILENVSDNGEPKFKNVTPEIAPGLEKAGLVTSAVWTDYNNDGWTDLIIAGEWMPLTVFKNEQGKFKNVTVELGLEDTVGWWFSVEHGDFDKDGDMDIIAGNLGLNYKYKATEDQTFDIYFNDFDKNNKSDIVLSYTSEGEKYPVRGRECSSQQIPAIKSKFEDYESFAVANLEDIYTEQDLKKSLHYQVKSFASVYLENRDGKFILHKLPNEAQFSSINKILIKDYDNDSNLDVLLSGNLYSSEVETPRNDASHGLFLKGNGKGEFEAVRSLESGWYTPGDVKDLCSITIGEKEHIVVAKNNDYLQLVQVN